MSCDVAAVGALWLAGFLTPAAAPAPMPVSVIMAEAPKTNALASEPLFAEIIRRAARLEGQVSALRGSPDPDLQGLPRLRDDAMTLAALDMKGHLDLAQRGTDGDLKCILKGISQDLPIKLEALASAPQGPARKSALDDLFYLLRDNVEVITAPPAPAA